jgi:spermidine synthase
VEISPDVVAASRWFADANGHVLDDARLHLAVEDAKSFLQLTDRTYDVIVSEPSNPWMAGVAGVFSREFYESCRTHLAADGLMTQWIHLYETSDEALDLVLRTFASVFPSISIWQSRPADLILIGSREPPRVDLQAMEAEFREPAVARDLDRIELTRLPVLLGREIVPERLGRFVPESGSRLHTDFRPILEFVAQKAFFVRRSADRWRVFDQNGSPRGTTLLAEYLKQHPPSEEDFRAFSRFHFASDLPQPDLMRSLFHRWQRDLPGSGELLQFSARLAGSGPAFELEALRWLPLRDTLFQRAGKNPSLLREYARILAQTYRSQRSIFFLPPGKELTTVLERLLETDPQNAGVYQLHLAELAWDAGNDEACVRLIQSAQKSPPSVDPTWSREFTQESPVHLVEALVRLGRIDQARAASQRFAESISAGSRFEVQQRKMEAALQSALVKKP